MGCLVSLVLLVFAGFLVNAGVQDGTATGGAMILVATFILVPLSIGSAFTSIGK